MPGTIVCFGDSNTYGYDSREFGGGRYPKRVRWTGLLEERTDCKILNRGVCGREIPHTRGQIEPVRLQVQEWRKEPAPVWLWIMLGGNDLLMNAGYRAEDAAARMQFFLSELKKEPAIASGEIKIRLIAPPYVWYGTWITEERIYQESRRMDDAYRKISEKMGIAFTPAGDWDIPVVFDGIHYSEDGHRKFADKIMETSIPADKS